jgi:hypothetical protein
VTIRLAKDDKKKSAAFIKHQIDKNLICSLDGCSKPLSVYDGPGSDSLCRSHQLKQREYNGLGRLDRPHTFHRKWVCDMCGIDIAERVRTKYPTLEETSPELFNRLCRNQIIGDHIVRKADGGADTEDNIQSLCLLCNSDKTILSEDYRKPLDK